MRALLSALAGGGLTAAGLGGPLAGAEEPVSGVVAVGEAAVVVLGVAALGVAGELVVSVVVVVGELAVGDVLVSVGVVLVSELLGVVVEGPVSV